jgi:general secretion pathway protein A
LYTEFFQLKEMPFALEPDSRFLVMADEHKEALATLIYAIEQREGWALLLGEAGVGKTTLIMALLRELGEVVVPAVVTNPLLDPLDFFNMIALELGMDGPYASKGQFLIALGQLISQCRKESKILLLVVDEAHSLTPRLLEELRLLGNLDSASPRVLNIFLVGQPKVVLLMKKAGARGLMQRLHRHYMLKPLSANEVAGYVRHRLEVAGGSPDIFDESALREVHSITNGTPRVINALCDETLLVAYGQGKRRVDRELVRQAAANDAPLLWPSRQSAPAASPKQESAPEIPSPGPLPAVPPEPEPREPAPAPQRLDGFPAPEAMDRSGGYLGREPLPKPEPEPAESSVGDAAFIRAGLKSAEPAPSKRSQKQAAQKAKQEAKQQAKQRKAGLGSRFASSMSRNRPGSLWRRLVFLIIILSLAAAAYVFTSQDGLRQVKRWWWIIKGRPGPELFLPDANTQLERNTKTKLQKSAGEKDWGPSVPLSPPADAPRPQGGQRG